MIIFIGVESEKVTLGKRKKSIFLTNTKKTQQKTLTTFAD